MPRFGLPKRGFYYMAKLYFTGKMTLLIIGFLLMYVVRKINDRISIYFYKQQMVMARRFSCNSA